MKIYQIRECRDGGKDKIFFAKTIPGTPPEHGTRIVEDEIDMPEGTEIVFVLTENSGYASEIIYGDKPFHNIVGVKGTFNEAVKLASKQPTQLVRSWEETVGPLDNRGDYFAISKHRILD